MVPGQNEIIIENFLSRLNEANPSPQCSQSILPFICLYYIGLCGGNGGLVQPTVSQCEDIQYRTCIREWEQLSTASGIILPDCEDFPDEQNISCQGMLLWLNFSKLKKKSVQ